MTHDKVERLVFVKFLLRQAEKQINLDRPLSSSAILTLHDAVECFLQLGFEQLTGKAKPPNNILDIYSDEINKVLSGKGENTINKSFIKRINELRNQLKHTSIFIDLKNIKNLYTESEIFFVDFSKIIFDLSFTEISLITLILNDEIKSHLNIASNELANENLHKALISISKAFYEVEILTTSISDSYGRSLIKKHHIIDYVIKYNAGVFKYEPNHTQKNDLREIAKDINRLQDDLYELKKALSLTVDFNSYLKFKSIIPDVGKIGNDHMGNELKENDFYVSDEKAFFNRELDKEEVHYCLNFVIDLSLKLNS